MVERQRIDWIDFAKGITILLVIIGHTTGNGLIGNVLHYSIFSFHMPLFFILSGYTLKFSSNFGEIKQRVKKNAKGLLVPFLITYLVLIFWQSDLSILRTVAFLKSAVVTFLYAGVGTTYNGVEGFWLYTWFLVALFVAKTIFDYLHLILINKQVFGPICCLVSLIGFVIGKVQLLPFSIDIALACQILLYVGQYLRNIKLEKKPLKTMAISFFIWFFSFWIVQADIYNLYALDVASRYYPLFPLCFLTAIAGTVVVIEFSILFTRQTYISKPICFLGSTSIYLLCIHSLDGKLENLWMNESAVIKCTRRIMLDLAIYFLIMIARKIVIKLYRKSTVSGKK